MTSAPVRRPVLRRSGVRLAFLLPAAAALLAGLDAALQLLGLPAPITARRLPEVHGMLLVLGFVGTVIALERAVALGRPRGYLAPALLGAGALALPSPLPLWTGKVLLLAGAAALVLLYLPLWRRQRDPAVLIQLLGAVAAAGAAALWLRIPQVPALLPWLAAFTVLTIAGERLELARLALRGRTAEPLLAALAFLLLAAAAATLLWPAAGYALLGLALLALVAWLTVHDVARRTIRSAGLPRYTAACLLAGYVWLAAAGLLFAAAGGPLGAAAYDAAVHAVFLGFTLSMVMAHAPVILPAVLRRPLPYHPVFYLPAALLHLSLLLRTGVAGTLGLRGLWQLAGALNITAVLLFAVTAAVLAARTHPQVKAARP